MGNVFLTTQFFNGILSHPNDNGFLTFTLGILFILTVYHFLLYFQHKDEIYLLYSTYTFFIILAHLIFVKDGFIDALLKPIEPIKNYRVVFTETYYIIYFFFAIKFLDVKSEFPKWTNFCYKAIYFLISLCGILFISVLITKDKGLEAIGYIYIFVPLMTLISIVVYVLFFRLKNKLKYYIIVGGLILSIFSYISLAQFYVLIEKGLDVQTSFSILYLGFILENILFSLGLGHKQKLILNQRDKSQEELIVQLKENERLKQKVQDQLTKDISILSAQAKVDKLEKVKSKYDKELAELKITSLRSQMNPHFIFNSLNSIKRYIIDNEKENAIYYLNKFSKLIRKILSASMEKQITLEDELETMELYVNIENIRLNKGIDFNIDVEDGLQINTIKIPSLILQPFLENAIWHGLSLKEGRKKLEIKIEKENRKYIQIHIIDNGIGRKRAAKIKAKKIHKRDSFGIKLTEERLKYFAQEYQSKCDLVFTDLEDNNFNATGTRVTLRLPIV